MVFLQLLLTTPWLLITTAVLFGLVVGSFLNVVIHRLPRVLEQGWQAECAELTGNPLPAGETYNLMLPRSRCPHCAHPIRAVENIPILSYVVLHGRCAACKAPISLRYPAVEALAGAFAGYIAWRFGASAAAAGAMLFAWTMIALAFIDLDTFYLPDNLTLPLLWVGLAFNIGATFTDLTSAVIGAAAGYLVLWAVFWAYKFATGKEGMGYGDFKLLAAIGAWLGWKMLPLVILLSSFVGAVIGIGLIVLARHGRNVPIPFGPYLALAGLIALFYGEQLTRQYLDLF
ncbi:MAG: A24 family peptidase [Betaproteobacteria bacterium]|nr:A24 family peptidase [Betaproteobacteria bacterium]MDH3436858.1 A24 family peptidase [Betaproteobacteria bacterium]